MASFTKLCKAIKDMVSHKAKGHWEWDTGSEHIQGTQEVGGSLELVAYFKAAKGGVVVDVDIEEDGDKIVEHQQAFQTEDPDAIAKYILQQISFGEKHHKRASFTDPLNPNLPRVYLGNPLEDPEFLAHIEKEKPVFYNMVKEGTLFARRDHQTNKMEFLKVTKLIHNHWAAIFDVIGTMPHPNGKPNIVAPNELDVKKSSRRGWIYYAEHAHVVCLTDLDDHKAKDAKLFKF